MFELAMYIVVLAGIISYANFSEKESTKNYKYMKNQKEAMYTDNR